MNRLSPTLMLITLTLAFAHLPPPDPASAQSVCSNTCPRCNTCCQLKAEKVDEEKNCWKVECQQICIPRVVFPWQKSCCDPCKNNGAYVKTIKVLKSHTYTCPACEYSWTPTRRTGTAPCGATGGCGHAGCGGGGQPTSGDVQEPLLSAPIPEPPAASLDAAYDRYFGMIAAPIAPAPVVTR